MKYIIQDITDEDYYAGPIGLLGLISWHYNPNNYNVIIFDSLSNANKHIEKLYIESIFNYSFSSLIIVSLEEAIKNFEIFDYGINI